MSGIVQRYLCAIVEHDWQSFEECLADDVVRIGPFGDTYEPKAPYVEFVSKLMPTLGGYSMRVDRIVESGDVVVAELTETVEIGGSVFVTPEALVFDLNSDGLIAKVDIFIKPHRDVPKAAAPRSESAG
jgi:ketosteroid isomerase-like protein